MDPVESFLIWADPVLIAPYRWLGNPYAAWWLGTFVLGLWCTLLGEITMGFAYRLNWRILRGRADDMVAWHNRAMNALRAGEKEIYTGSNKLANEAFGKAFFQNLAMGMGALWPLFFALEWLSLHFKDTLAPVPFVEEGFNRFAAFLILYILGRVLFAKLLKKRLPFFKRSHELSMMLAPNRRMDLLRHTDKKDKGEKEKDSGEKS